MGPFPQAGQRIVPDRGTYFKGKICSRYVLLEICCASMVRYKVCRLLEHRLVGLSQAMNAQPHSCLLVYCDKSAFFLNGYESVGILRVILFLVLRIESF